MTLKPALRRTTAMILTLIMLVTLIPLGDFGLFQAHAATVGTTTGGQNITVSSIEFTKSHTGLSVTGARLYVVGDNLTGLKIWFDLGNGLVLAGTRSADSSDETLVYTLNQTEAAQFTGRIQISSRILTIVSQNFPYISSIQEPSINKDVPDTQTLNGGGLNRIGTDPSITATYGKGTSVKAIVPLPGATSSRVSFTPPADTLLGLQDITFTEVGQLLTADPEPIETTVKSVYSSAFRVVKSLTLADLSMFPNSAARGETISITSALFPASSGYQVYFLGADETYSAVNKSPSVVLSGDRKKLTVQVPTGAIDLGSKTVKIVDTLSGEIISEATVPGTFNLIDATNRPTITDISPASGTDSGSPVNIKGMNLLTPVFTDLVTPASVTVDAATRSIDLKELTLQYNTGGFFYQGAAVTSAQRKVRVIIGAAATFEPFTAPAAVTGDDLLKINTVAITDAATDPLKDVVVEMETTIVAGGQTYVYNQVASRLDGYTFIPNSVKPVITDVTPDRIHIDTSRYMKANTLISIEGSDFMVNRWTDGTGKTHVNYPVVVIQKTATLGTSDLILMFDKNGNPANTTGRIYYNDGSGIQVLQDGGVDVPVDMVVLDKNNKVVDGTTGNEVGTRIVLYLPTLARIDAEASRNVKVLNPKRDSDDLGMESLALDALSFVMEPPAPVLESVSPTIVTAGGGEEVTITGSTSIEEGAEVYIDGRKVNGVTRSIDINGNKVLLKFKAPPGRLGKTQLAVVNPLGGIAVRDFFYVQSFNKDPLITTVAPDKGTEGTLVVIAGDNFFKPDPSVASEAGMDAYRLIGTRALIDGVEVNQYNKGSYGEIVFNDYTSPAGDDLLQILPDDQGVLQARASDYAHSVILQGVSGYYVLDTLFDGTLRLTNGQQNSYTIRLNGTEDGFLADKDGGATVAVTVADDGLTVGGEALAMITPYTVSGGKIVGNRTRVISKNQLAVTIPRLTTAGLKDMAVENPDTKRATKAKSFTYYDSPFPQPDVTSVVPNIGSISGGYFISIIGSNFEAGTQVYLDGLLVPAADTAVNAAGTLITIKVPKYSRNLADYNTDRITVPLVVVNLNAGTSSLPKGFTYISPSKEPTLTKVQLNSGSTNGGEVVELEGTNFTYYAPFKNRDGVAGYQPGNGDTYTDLNGNGQWDDISTLSSGNPPDALLEATAFPNGATYMFYSQYYDSPILPKVYFGTREAYIVSYGKGKITVVTPPGSAAAVDVYVVNNDSGISNKLKYTYKASSPKITYMNPTQGARVGQENRDIYGTGFAQSYIGGYGDDDASGYVAEMDGVEALVRFADITNRKIALGQANDGKIGGGEQAIVTLEGGLSMLYNGSANTITVNLEENGKLYSRTFSGYDDKKVLIPAGMLRNGTDYYVPNGFANDGTVYNAGTHYELFLVEVDPVAGRFFVERGYAPRVIYDNATHLNLDTPSYYSVGVVNVTVTNPDGGFAVTKYTYKNPASRPTITLVKPQTLMDGGGAYMVEASVKGGITIEIKGHDFRDNVKVYIDKKPMEVLDITTDTVTDPGNTLEVIIARVPAGAVSEIGLQYPILVENTDGAIASSVDPKTLSSADKFPIYFIYRNPLSDPVITAVTPAETSIAGGNPILITGTDFRAGTTVIIGSKGGIPVTPDSVDPRGTWIKFTTPVGLLTLGAKDIQVVNSDFGTGIKANGLKIISDPVVDTVTAEGGGTLEWLSVEGGGKLRLTGTGFASGAKVIFGGTRAEKGEGAATGLTGLWKNDKYYTVTDGVLATAVQFVDDKNLIVTAPAVTKEKDFTITVLNADGGISDGDDTVKYSVPVPSAPLNLDAEIVSNKYIKIFGYTSSNFDYFEIYTYIGNTTASKLKSNDYRDFKYLATAQTEPYRITRLEGLDKMKSSDRVYIVLKAVNKYGPSSWSNIASLRFSEIDEIQGGLGVEDFDGAIDVPKGQAYSSQVSAQQAVVNLSRTDLRTTTLVDLSGPTYSLVGSAIVNVPEALVGSNFNRVTLRLKSGQLAFYPAALNSAAFQQIAAGDGVDTYANLRMDPVTTEYAGLIQRYIPRELKAYSAPYRVTLAASSNYGTTELSTLSGTLELGLNYPALAPGVNAGALRLYWYDTAASRWVQQTGSVDVYNRRVTANLNRPGIYMVLGPR